MEAIRTLDRIVDMARGQGKRLIVAGGNAPTVIESIARAVKDNIIEATLVGDRKQIETLAHERNIDHAFFSIIDETDVHAIPEKAVEFVRQGKADFLMKGMINTADYMRAILNKNKGLLEKDGLLTHVTVIEVPTYHKLLIVSDVAILVSPNLSQKIAMLDCCVRIARALGIESPKAGIVSCVEKPSYKIDSTIDGSIMKKLTQRDKIKDVLVDGPLAIDLAISERCAKEKNYESPVAGDCDILIFPNICTANVFFKTLTILADARIAAIVVGARVPCVLTSRADSEESKFASISLGALLS
jgi:phosphate butyryltransferase